MPIHIKVGGKNLCAEITPEENHDDAPNWNDDRIDSDSGKIEIINQATLLALNKIGKLGDDSWLNRFVYSFYINKFMESKCITNHVVVENDRQNNRLKRVFYISDPSLWNTCNSQLRFNKKYVRFNRKANSAGASLATIERVIVRYNVTDAYCYCGDDAVLPCGEESYNLELLPELKNWDFWNLTPRKLNLEKELKCEVCEYCYREELIINIEISPEIFKRGYLKIPSEDNRYAISLTEAMQYIILHEFGHIEYFLSKESKCGVDYNYNLLEQDSSEISAWEYASSVMGYKQEFTIKEAFIQSFYGSYNKYHDLQSSLKDLSLDFYKWYTNLPDISIHGLSFTSEIWERRSGNRFKSIQWYWESLPTEYIKKGTIDKVLGEIKSTGTFFGVENWQSKKKKDGGTEYVNWIGKGNNFVVDITLATIIEKNPPHYVIERPDYISVIIAKK